jgi:hypothetical protein
MLQSGLQAGWRELAAEAAQALAHLDADRLQELATSARALHQEFRDSSPAQRLNQENQVRAASNDIALLGGVLAATHANLCVLRRAGRRVPAPLEYIQPGSQTFSTEALCGHH